MKFTLRPYQQLSVNAIRDCFYSQQLSSAILCIPTGGGKTVVFSHIANSAIKKGNKIMIACDRKELISQAYSKLKSYGLWPTIIAPGQNYVKNHCYVASVDTLRSRGIMPDIDVLIIDEAHKAKFDKLVDMYYGKCLIIGATATPIRKGKQNSLHKYYKSIVKPVHVSDLISEGYLAPAITYGAEINLDALNSNRLEYNEKELFDFYDKQVMYEGVVDKYKQFAQGPTLIFNVNREHSRNTVEQFKKEGINAVHVDGSFSNFDRAKILNKFYHGDIEVLSNCSILTTGYDNERIQTVMVNRATMSLALWLQMCGRGSRPDPDNGKTHFNIIDMGSNIKKHGFWEEDREWTLKKRTKRNSLQPAPIKECKQCEAYVYASATSCPHCGYVFPKKEKKLVDSEFTQIVKPDIPNHLRKPFNEMDRSELEEYRKIKGYKSGWTYVQMKLKSTKNRKVSKSSQ